jgi:hypothetical protein
LRISGMRLELQDKVVLDGLDLDLIVRGMLA